MESEKKALSFEIKEGKLIISVDPNKDGQPVVYLTIDMAEVPDEIVSIFKKD